MLPLEIPEDRIRSERETGENRRGRFVTRQVSPMSYQESADDNLHGSKGSGQLEPDVTAVDRVADLLGDDADVPRLRHTEHS